MRLPPESLVTLSAEESEYCDLCLTTCDCRWRAVMTSLWATCAVLKDKNCCLQTYVYVHGH